MLIEELIFVQYYYENSKNKKMPMKTLTLAVITVFLFNFLATGQGVQINSGTDVTVASGTTMVLADGDLLLKSDINDDASLIVLGTVAINGTGKKQ